MSKVTMAVTKFDSGAMHCPSIVDPVFEVIRPATHFVHSAIPGLSAYVERGHAVHSFAAPSPEKWPTGHNLGSAEPEVVRETYT